MNGAIPRRWVYEISDILRPGEKVELAVAEHRIASPKPFARAIVFCTNHRIIILRKNYFRTYRTYKIIHYREIIHVAVHRGFYFSRVHFGQAQEEAGEEEWKVWIWGLDRKDVGRLARFVEEREGRNEYGRRHR